MASLPPDDPITFERHGGFGGIVLRATFTAGELSETEAEAIAAIQQEAVSGAPSPQPDRFEYHLVLPSGLIVIGEEELPDTLRPLVARLLERARHGS
ncbi:MAG TPA: protealysin inhibitor emfourin [Acidimicrobiia bacterium]|nr:protealysin inhibitor emfourin [Acidimicrobiia bacterium]